MERSKKGFFSFSGIDGSGKTSVIQEIDRTLNQKGISSAIFVNHEPFSAYWNNIKKIKDALQMCGRDLDYETDRIFHTLELMIKLDQGLPKLFGDNSVVLSDRYVLDKLVYGGLRGDMGITREVLLSLNHIPEVTFFLDISPELAYERLIKRGPPYDWKENLEILNAARERYNMEIQTYEGKVIKIDASKSLEEITQIILDYIYNKLFIERI